MVEWWNKNCEKKLLKKKKKITHTRVSNTKKPTKSIEQTKTTRMYNNKDFESETNEIKIKSDVYRCDFIIA